MNTLDAVLTRRDVWRGDRLAEAPAPTIASGWPALDEALPGGGWPRGALTEILVDGNGLGELSLVLPALAALREEGGWSLAVAPPHGLHAPAWAAAGVDLNKLVVVCPGEKANPRSEAWWALEQALASGAPGAVLGWGGGDSRTLRRLQVAAAASHSLAFVFRPARFAQEASAAPLRLHLLGWRQGRLAVRLLKRRGPPLITPLLLALPRPIPCFDGHDASLACPRPAAAAAGSPLQSAIA